MHDRHHRINILPAALLSATLAVIGTGSFFNPAIAGEGCSYRLGDSVTGQPMTVDLCSIRLIPKSFNVRFSYTIDGERISANANCRSNNWYIPSDDTTHVPRSQATENMLKIVCTAPHDGGGDRQLNVIFNPPSNIRRSPDGAIICTVNELRTISVDRSRSSGDWLRTSRFPGCGNGYIHSSQLAPLAL